jgi:hypothetical protein
VDAGTPAEVVGLMFRLSRQEPGASRALAESVLRWTAELEPLHAFLMRGPSWAAALIQGMETAELGADQREDWNARLAFWSRCVAKALADMPSGVGRAKLESVRTVVDAAPARG